MKNALNKFKQILILSFISFYMSSCLSYKAVQIKDINSVQLLDNNLASGKLLIKLRVINPNNYAIKVKKYDLHAYINNADLGLVEVGEKIVIPGNSDKEYQLTFTPDVSKIMDQIPSMLLTGKGETALKGTVKIKASLLSKKFNVDLKKRISASDFR